MLTLYIFLLFAQLDYKQTGTYRSNLDSAIATTLYLHLLHDKIYGLLQTNSLGQQGSFS